MSRVLLMLAVLVLSVFAARSDSALAVSPTSLKFLPPDKFTNLTITAYDETNVDTDLPVGQAAANERRAQGFKLPVGSAVGGVMLWLKASGAPTDDLTVQIQTNSSGVPSGTVVTNGASDPAQSSYGETSNVDTHLAVGESTANERRAQGFTVLTDRSISQVRLWLKKSGAPTDNVTLEIQTDSGGLPSGTVVTNGVSNAVAGSSVGGSYGWLTFAFSVPPQLTAGTQYHLALKRSGSVDGVNYYVWGADQSVPSYRNGAASVYETSWQVTSTNTDHAFRVIAASVSYGWVAFDFSVPPQLTAGTQYHLVLKRSGAVDGSNYYLWGADQSSPGYADGAGSVYGGSWQATSPATDHAFQVRPALTVDVWAQWVYTTNPCPLPPGATQACGLGGYELEVDFNPTKIHYVSIQNGPMLASTGRLIYQCWSPAPHNPAGGVITYQCTTTGNPPPPVGNGTPFGPQGSGVLATITFAPVSVGTTDLQFQDTLLPEIWGDPAVPHTTELGSVTVGDYGNGDSDGDGCADIEEVGDDPFLGGDRNPSDPWDFYDVTVPAMPDPTPNGARDKAVAMDDVLAVLFYVGTYNGDGGLPGPNGVAYDSDKGVDTDGDTVADIPPDGVPDGLPYDRTASWPFSGAPDGAIALDDVLAALGQASHGCVDPP